MSQSPVDSYSKLKEPTPTLDRYQSGWNKLNELLRNGGSLSGREQNCCYLNLGAAVATRFADVSHVSGFDGSVDGRGLALTDWDRDGDLDVWTSNRTGPRVQYLRNDTQPSRHFVSLRLQGTKSNRDAIGARVEIAVRPTVGVLSRTVVAGDAYLSQSSKWLHFGLGEAEEIESVRVRWPGTRDFQPVAGVTLDGEFHLVEGEANAVRRELVKTPSTSSVFQGETQRSNVQNKMTVVGRLPLPPIQVQFAGQETGVLSAGQPTLVLFWSTQCADCNAELTHWSQQMAKARNAGLEVVAISADGDSLPSTRAAIEQTRFPFTWAVVEPLGLEMIEAYLGFLQQDYQRPLAVPMSFLIDQYGQVAVFYRGAVSVEEVLDDVSVLDRPPEELRRTGLPFAGRWIRPLVRPGPTDFATRLSERFGTPAAIAYFEHLIEIADREPNSPYSISKRWKGQALHALGTIALSEGRFLQAARYSEQAQKLLPTDFRSFANQGAALLKLNRPQEALIALNEALELSPDRPSVLVNRATLFGQMGQHRKAIDDWETILRVNPDDERPRLTVAALAFAIGDDQRAVTHYSHHLRRHPDSADAAGALAWILATSNDAEVRDGMRALQLAARWSEQSRGRNYKALNTLAAALAEQGEFAKAIAAIDRAIELAVQSGDSRAAASYRARREIYRSENPFRRQRPSG